VSRRYLIRPKADEDLDDQAVYDAAEGSPALGRRFLVAAHKTFALLSTQPEMGCSPKFKRRALVGARIFRIRE